MDAGRLVEMAPLATIQREESSLFFDLPSLHEQHACRLLAEDGDNTLDGAQRFFPTLL